MLLPKPTPTPAPWELLERWQQQAGPADEAWADTSVLVIGAKGFLGLSCLHEWLAVGAQVTALTRGHPMLYTHPRLQWVQGDLQELNTIQVLGSLPGIVVCAAPIWLLAPVLPQLAAQGVTRVIAFSSTSVHTKTDSQHRGERALAARLLQNEEGLFEAGRTHQVGITILRPTLIYGIGLDRNVTTLARLLRKLPIFPLPTNAQGLRQPVHAMDLAAATLAIAGKPETIGQVYEVGGGERLPYRDMVARINEVQGSTSRLLPLPGLAFAADTLSGLRGNDSNTYGDIIRRMGKDMVFDDSAARAAFGWNPRGFLDATRQPAGTPFF